MILTQSGNPTMVIGYELGAGKESASVGRKWQEDILPHYERPSIRFDRAPAVFLVSVQAALGSSDSAAISKELMRAAAAPNDRVAYSSFESALRTFEDSLDHPTAPITRYLADPSASYKDSLLACMADREVNVSDVRLLAALVALLSDDDRYVARTAALALQAGGESAVDALTSAIAQLSQVRRSDLEQLLALDQGR